MPELTLYDLLEPTTSKEQQVKAAADEAIDADDDHYDIDDDNEDAGEEEEHLSVSVNDSLNTPRTKKAPIVRILENKRITGPAPIGTALKNMLGGPIKVVSTQPTKQTTQITDVKILNKMQTQPMKTFGNAPIKIGNTTIAAPTAAGTVGATVSPKSFSGVTMAQIKTADGKVLFVQKSLPGAATGIGQKVTVTGTASAPRVINQATTTTTVSSASGIRQTVLPKGVTITSTGLIKTNTSSSIAVRGLTTIGSTKSTTAQPTTAATSSTTVAAPTSPTVVTNNVPIKVVRTPDGKLIKLNQGAPSVLLNAKPGTVAVRPTGSAATTTATVASKGGGSVVINKPTAQVIIKGPLKQLPSGASLRPVINSTSTSTTTTTATTTSGGNSSSSSSSIVSVTTAAGGVVAGTSGATAAAAALPAGKMLIEGTTGKQIVVASKNIIKLSPSTSTSTTAAPAITTASGLHAIQLSGKSGVQYVRVLPNTSTSGNKVTVSPQKVPLGRPRTSSNSKGCNPTVSVSNTSKIVMKTMGGSIVPLPSMHTLVPRVSNVCFGHS